MTLKTLQLDIPRRNGDCTECRQKLSEGTPYYSVLNELTENLSPRQDYCVSCWDRSPQKLKLAKCHWKSRVPSKKENPLSSLEKEERALALLKEAISGKKLENEAEAFVLALYLARKRIIQFRQEIEEFGQTYSLYEIIETEEMLPVKKIQLGTIDIVKIQAEIANKLK